MTNFAAQAVIAIENTRLLNELRQRTDELGRSVGELRALGEVSQAVNSTLDLKMCSPPSSPRRCSSPTPRPARSMCSTSASREFHLRATYGMDQELIEALVNARIDFDDRNVAADVGGARARASRRPARRRSRRRRSRSSCAPATARG